MPVSDSLVPVVPPRGAPDPGGGPVSPLDGGGGGGRRGARLSAQPVAVEENKPEPEPASGLWTLTQTQTSCWTLEDRITCVC